MVDMEFPDEQLSQLLTGIQAKISVKLWFCHSYLFTKHWLHYILSILNANLHIYINEKQWF